MDTRTWLTTPVGATPLEDRERAERWAPGPDLPTEPPMPNRYRGALVQLAVLLVVIGLTFLLAPAFTGQAQDPTFGGAPAGEA